MAGGDGKHDLIREKLSLRDSWRPTASTAGSPSSAKRRFSGIPSFRFFVGVT